MGDDRTLGQVLHEARVAGGEARPRPWPPEDWAHRDERLKVLDEAMAAAVATQAVADAGFDQAAMAAAIIRLQVRLDAAVSTVCKRIARACEERASALVPCDERNAWLSAAGVALAARERSDDKEPQS